MYVPLDILNTIFPITKHDVFNRKSPSYNNHDYVNKFLTKNVNLRFKSTFYSKRIQKSTKILIAKIININKFIKTFYYYFFE